jgi:multidrug efflux system membrane fusion protein
MDPHTTETPTRLDRPALPAPDHETLALPPGPTFRAPHKKDAGTPHRKGRKWIWLLLLVSLAIAGFYFWSKRTPAAPQGDNSKGGGRRGGRGGGVPPVVAVKARKGNIGVYYTGVGGVTPINTVTVKSRVDGQLMSVSFKEGDMVKQGDTLAEIDPRPFQAQLTQFEGQLAKDQASLENAKLDLVRYQTLIAQNAVAGQQLDTQKATVQQFEGTVKTDQGQIEGVKLNIAYSHITAPITGRIGLRLVDPGNIVHASDSNGLLVITQIQPISVIFTIPEDQLQVVIKKWHAGQHLQVEAYDREMQNKIAQGTLTTVDNQVDQTTGTLRLRATFENANGALFPNQFVNARLLVEEKRGVVLLSSAAIQRNSNMTYVYLVKPDSTVTVRQITPGVSEGNDTEVASGLVEGDVVVMTGVDKLTEGQKVVVHMDGEAAPTQPGGKRGGGGRRQGK